MNDNQSTSKFLMGAFVVSFLVIIYFLFRLNTFGTVSAIQVSGSVNLLAILFTGLFIGGLTCLAVQGGLLASTIAAREEEDIEQGKQRKHTLWPIAAFLATKFVAYVILGFLLGTFGQALALSDSLQITMQLIAGVYMLVIALNLLNVHPIFRYAVLQPPRFLTRIVRNQSKSKDIFAPAFLGAMTVFIPCGTTIAMEALAISSSNPFMGASVMGVFVLGTMPLFFGLGFLTTTLGDAFKTKFLKLAAFVVLYLGITSVNGALVAGGSPVTLQSLAENSPIQVNLSGDQSATGSQKDTSNSVKVLGGVQTADITVLPNGYSPTYFQVKAGVPVKLNLTPSGGLGCTSVFRMPQLGISKRLFEGSTETVEFTPQSLGKITYTCSMGMYRGVIDVVI